MKSDVAEVLHRVEHAERVLLRLEEARVRCQGHPLDECGWLDAARARLRGACAAVRAAVADGLALPELKGLRAEREGGLEREWLAALRGFFEDLRQQVGEGSPLVEALFPHRRFDKLERGGAALRAYHLEFSSRRRSAYVRRLATEPDYSFLPTLLERMDCVGEALAASLGQPSLDETQLLALRASIVQAGDGLSRTLRQARALSEAALIDEPELFAVLGFNERRQRNSGSI